MHKVMCTVECKVWPCQPEGGEKKEMSNLTLQITAMIDNKRNFLIAPDHLLVQIDQKQDGKSHSNISDAWGAAEHCGVTSSKALLGHYSL